MSLPTAVPLTPPPTLLASASPEYLLIVVADELGVPYVVRLRIARGG